MIFSWGMAWLHDVVNYTLEFIEVAFFGFFFAGLLQAVVHPAVINRYLSGSLMRANLVGASIGFFTPLCCCTAIPTALSLWRSGSRAGPACAFLIATPWFNWYALVALWVFLGWRFALIVASSAVVIAFATGVLIDVLGSHRKEYSVSDNSRIQKISSSINSLAGFEESCCTLGRHCKPERSTDNGQRFFDFSEPSQKLRMAWRTTWGLVHELLPWISAGIVLGATAKMLLPTHWIHQALGGHGWLVSLLALGIATIIYTDSLGSLPMINALLSKGLGVGSAMILLVAGVGTNISTLGPISKEMGMFTAVVYASGVAFLALTIGMLWNNVPSIIH